MAKQHTRTEAPAAVQSLGEGVLQAAARLAAEPQGPGYVGEVRKGRHSPWVRVQFPKLLCPFCHSDAIRTYSTKPRPPSLVIRWHICNACRRSFQSSEQVSTKPQS